MKANSLLRVDDQTLIRSPFPSILVWILPCNAGQYNGHNWLLTEVAYRYDLQYMSIAGLKWHLQNVNWTSISTVTAIQVKVIYWRRKTLSQLSHNYVAQNRNRQNIQICKFASVKTKRWHLKCNENQIASRNRVCVSEWMSEWDFTPLSKYLRNIKAGATRNGLHTNTYCTHILTRSIGYQYVA